MKQSDNAYQDLANAIILQAVKDYRQSLASLKRNPESFRAQYLKKDVEKFFLSGWFIELTELDGERLLQDLRKEADWHEE